MCEARSHSQSFYSLSIGQYSHTCLLSSFVDPTMPLAAQYLCELLSNRTITVKQNKGKTRIKNIEVCGVNGRMYTWRPFIQKCHDRTLFICAYYSQVKQSNSLEHVNVSAAIFLANCYKYTLHLVFDLVRKPVYIVSCRRKISCCKLFEIIHPC